MSSVNNHRLKPAALKSEEMNDCSTALILHKYLFVDKSKLKITIKRLKMHQKKESIETYASRKH